MLTAFNNWSGAEVGRNFTTNPRRCQELFWVYTFSTYFFHEMPTFPAYYLHIFMVSCQGAQILWRNREKVMEILWRYLTKLNFYAYRTFVRIGRTRQKIRRRPIRPRFRELAAIRPRPRKSWIPLYDFTWQIWNYMI